MRCLEPEEHLLSQAGNLAAGLKDETEIWKSCKYVRSGITVSSTMTIIIHICVQACGLFLQCGPVTGGIILVKSSTSVREGWQYTDCARPARILTWA